MPAMDKALSVSSRRKYCPKWHASTCPGPKILIECAAVQSHAWLSSVQNPGLDQPLGQQDHRFEASLTPG